MRLVLNVAVRPETIDRLRAFSPELEMTDVSGDAAFDIEMLIDPGVEILVGDRPPSDLAQVPSLRWLQTGSAGVDHLAADPPWRKHIVVTNARGVFAIPIAEYVSGMLLRVNQPAAWAADQAVRRWPTDASLVTLLRGRTAVLLGYGSIGREVARQLSALGMRIVAVKPRPDLRHDTAYRVPGTGDPDGSIPERIVDISELTTTVAEADVLVLTLPLTEASRGIVAAEVLAAMRPSSWLINVSRGAIVDESALLDALRGGRLAGAVLDVFRQEPLGADSPWWDAPNVIVTPHSSGMTHRFYDELLIENVRRYLGGEPLLNQVDPERGY